MNPLMHAKGRVARKSAHSSAYLRVYRASPDWRWSATRVALLLSIVLMTPFQAWLLPDLCYARYEASFSPKGASNGELQSATPII